MDLLIRTHRRLRTLLPERIRTKKVVLALIALSINLDVLNVTGAITTSASIEESFNTDSVTASWVLSAYALTLGSFIIVFGKLADVLGAHLVLIAGMFAMCVFQLLCAVVTGSIIAILVFRAFQGVAGAAILPACFALCAAYFQDKELQIALTIVSGVFTGSLSVGLVLGGAFSLTSAGYQGFFYLTFGLSAVCLVLLYLTVIPVEKDEAHKNLKLSNVNFLTALLLVTSLLLVILGLTNASTGWNSPKVYVPLAIGVVLFVSIFAFENVYLAKFREQHAKTEEFTTTKKSSIALRWQKWKLEVDLLFPFEAFKVPNFTILLVGVFLVIMGYITMMNIFVQYYTFVHNDSPLMASVKVLPIGVGLATSTILYNDTYFMRKFGPKVTIIFAGCLLLPAAAWLTKVNYHTPHEYWKLQLVPFFMLGYGTNLFYMVYINAIMSQTPLHLQGVIQGIFQTSSQVGISVSAAILATVTGVLHKNETNDDAVRSALSKKIQNGIYIVLAGNALFFLISWLIKDPRRK